MITFDEFIRWGEIQSKMPQYKARKKAAVELCVSLFDQYAAPYVALSGGKDSAAMCFLVDEAVRISGKDFRIWSHISDASFPGTRETCEQIASRLGRPLDLFESTSAFEALKNPQKKAFGKSGVFFDSVRKYAQDKDLAFVGVRARESSRRRKAANIKGQVFSSQSMGNVTVCYPLLWFTLEDVAALMYEYGVPVHPIYRKIAINSQKNNAAESNFIRLSYATSRDLLNKGTAVFIKVNYPEIYEKLTEAWPEIRLWV